MLTTAGESVDRIVGLELGADDYLPKPSRCASCWRAHAPCRAGVSGVWRPGRRRAGHAPVRFGDRRSISTSAACSAAKATEVEISAAEYDLLALFARHPNRPLNRDQIMEQAHNRGWDVFDRSIDLRVMRLRRKIERNPDKTGGHQDRAQRRLRLRARRPGSRVTLPQPVPEAALRRLRRSHALLMLLLERRCWRR